MMEKLNLNELKEFYKTTQLQDDTIYVINGYVLNLILDLKPTSVFEFGCNQGKNLAYLENGGIEDVSGIDLAWIKHPRTCIGDEESLNKIASNSFDIMFTNSVLGHIPPEDVLNIIGNLKRIAKKHVILGEIGDDIDNDRWFYHDFDKYGFSKITEIESGMRKYFLWQYDC